MQGAEAIPTNAPLRCRRRMCSNLLTGVMPYLCFIDCLWVYPLSQVVPILNPLSRNPAENPPAPQNMSANTGCGALLSPHSSVQSTWAMKESSLSVVTISPSGSSSCMMSFNSSSFSPLGVSVWLKYLRVSVYWPSLFSFTRAICFPHPVSLGCALLMICRASLSSAISHSFSMPPMAFKAVSSILVL